MELFLVRHGIAEDLGDSKIGPRHDSERRLTEKGIERCEEVAKFLQKRQPDLDKIIHSPYLRAVETAKIFSQLWPKAAVLERAGFLPMDSTKKSLAVIESETTHIRSLMVVGHEPHLSHLLGLLLTGNSVSFVAMKKAGIAHVEWDEFGGTRLLALIPPKYSL